MTFIFFTYELTLYFFNSLQNLWKWFKPNYPIKFKKSYAFSPNLIIPNVKKLKFDFFQSEEVLFSGFLI